MVRLTYRVYSMSMEQYLAQPIVLKDDRAVIQVVTLMWNDGG